MVDLNSVLGIVGSLMVDLGFVLGGDGRVGLYAWMRWYSWNIFSDEMVKFDSVLG